MNLSAFAHLNGLWVAKKSCMPICNIRPALILTMYPNKLRFVDENGNNYRLPKQLPIKLQLLQQLEAIHESKARLLNNMYTDSNEVCNNALVETAATAHFRSDDGKPKKAFTATNFHDALYALKLKFPNHNCSAYECVECKQIHIGKI